MLFRTVREQHGYMPNGNAGPTGAGPDRTPIAGNPGKASVGFVASKIPPTAIRDHLDGGLLRIVLHSAELDYMNGELPIAGEKLAWLIMQTTNVTAPAPGTGVGSDVPSGPYPDAEPADGDSTLDYVRNRALQFKVQLGAGLDYFGFATNYVSLQKYTEYSKVATLLLNNGREIEKEFGNFTDRNKEADARRKAARAVVAAKSTEVNALDTLNDQLDDQLGALSNDIYDLSQKLITMQGQLVVAQRAFTDAVQAKYGGCSFLDVLSFTASVVSIASGVGTIAGGIMAAGSTLDTLSKTETDGQIASGLLGWTDDKNIIKSVKPLKGNLTSIKNGYNSVKSGLKELEDNSQKLAMAQEDFDSQLQDFKSLPEAKDYKHLVDSYTATAKARNDKAAQYTSLKIQQAENNTKIADTKDAISTAKDNLRDAFNLNDVAIQKSLTAAVDQSKILIIKVLDRCRRSFEFYTFDTFVPSYSDHTIAQLCDIFDDWNYRLLNANDRRNRSPQPFGDSFRIISQFSRNSQPSLFDYFDKTGSIVFRISPDDEMFANMTEVRVQKFTINGVGLASTTTPIRGLLTQMGRSEFRNQSGNHRTFTHYVRPTTISCLVEQGKWSGGPFELTAPESFWADVGLGGLWELSLRLDASQRAQLHQISLEYFGTFMPPSVGPT